LLCSASIRIAEFVRSPSGRMSSLLGVLAKYLIRVRDRKPAPRSLGGQRVLGRAGGPGKL
jgi:hypothetical protein